MMNQAAERMKEQISMEDVLDKYGFEIKRGRFINCPFHSGDQTASLKVYPGGRGWHCFGCGAGGSVIDFVMRLFDLQFGQALLRLDNDFGIGIFQSPPDHLKSRKISRERAEARKREMEWERKYNALWDRFAAIDRILSQFPPKDDDSAAIAGQLMGTMERLWWEIDQMNRQKNKGVSV